jgi:hypothetical protein
MAKPLPPPEDARVRTTISLKAKIYRMAERYRAMHPEEELDDFSAVVSRALVHLAKANHPELLAQVIEEIRRESATAARDEPVQTPKMKPLPARPQPEAQKKKPQSDEGKSAA